MGPGPQIWAQAHKYGPWPIWAQAHIMGPGRRPGPAVETSTVPRVHVFTFCSEKRALPGNKNTLFYMFVFADFSIFWP